MSRLAEIRKRYQDVIVGASSDAVHTLHVYAVSDIGTLLSELDRMHEFEHHARALATLDKRNDELKSELAIIRRALGLSESATTEETLDVLDDALCAKHEWEARRTATFEDIVEASLKAQVIARFVDVQESVDAMRVAIHDAEDVVEVYRRARRTKT